MSALKASRSRKRAMSIAPKKCPMSAPVRVGVRAAGVSANAAPASTPDRMSTMTASP